MNFPDLARTLVDKVVEGPVLTSFTSIGYDIRSRVDDWTDLDQYDLSGRTVVVTGATSGLGRAAAAQFLWLGADVIILGRDAERTERARDALADETGSDSVSVVIADMGELDQVRSVAEQLLAERPQIDVLVHNAGALSDERRTNSDGVEATIASQVVGPHLLTTMLLPALRAAAPGRVLTMSSGGMYAAGLTVRQLEMSADDYGGSEQYARAKRAQVTLNEIWADRVDPAEVVFHALHPGWADTPGVESSLPRFHKVLGPILRSVEQGIDTLIWLGADPEPGTTSGGFWLDRRQRSIHKLPTTKRTDTTDRRESLWRHASELAGVIAD
jgi:NAD(P)-dependent dehydrogenase (short-subunit alcohol dehydrogenase family)